MSFFSISFSSCFHFTRLSPRLVVFFCRGKIIRKKEGNNERGSWIFFFLCFRELSSVTTRRERKSEIEKKGEKEGGKSDDSSSFSDFFLSLVQNFIDSSRGILSLRPRLSLRVPRMAIRCRSQ